MPTFFVSACVRFLSTSIGQTTAQAVVDATPETMNCPSGVAKRFVFLRAHSTYMKKNMIRPVARGKISLMPRYIWRNFHCYPVCLFTLA